MTLTWSTNAMTLTRRNSNLPTMTLTRRNSNLPTMTLTRSNLLLRVSVIVRTKSLSLTYFELEKQIPCTRTLGSGQTVRS